MSSFRLVEGPFEVRFDSPDILVEGELGGAGVYLLQAGDMCWDIAWVVREPFVDADEQVYELESAIGDDANTTVAFQVPTPWWVGVKVKNPPDALVAGRADVFVTISRTAN